MACGVCEEFDLNENMSDKSTVLATLTLLDPVYSGRRENLRKPFVRLLVPQE